MKLIRFVIGAALISTALGQGSGLPYKKASLPSSGVVLPMLKSARLVPIVEVKVNGQGPYRFAIDTCAGGGAHVSEDIVKAAKLEKSGVVLAGDGTGKNNVEIPVYRIPTLDIGGFVLNDVEAASRRNPALASGEVIDGVLGFRLFAEGVLKFDFKDAKVLFAKGALKPSSDTLELRIENSIATVPVSVGARTFWAHFDSGAEGGFAMPESERENVAKGAPTRVLGHAKTNFNEFDIVGAKLQEPMKLGPFDFGQIETAFLPLFRTANIGERIMRRFDSIEFDQANRLVKLNGFRE